MKDFLEVLNSSDDVIFYDEPDEPLQTPVTVRDLEMNPDMILDMELHLADPCPNCGAFNMRVGDWVCFGVCGVCI